MRYLIVLGAKLHTLKLRPRLSKKNESNFQKKVFSFWLSDIYIAYKDTKKRPSEISESQNMQFESENPIFESDVQMFRECITDAQEHESLVEIKNRARWSICNTIRK